MRVSCVMHQHLKANIQTSSSIKLLDLQFSNFTWSMTRLQGLSNVKLGRSNIQDGCVLLKIAKTTKSISSPENFGMEYQWKIGVQNCKNEKNL